MTYIRPVAYVDPFAFTGSLYARRHRFDAVTLRQAYPGSPHRDTRSILLRVPEAATPARWFEDVPHVDTEDLEDWPEARDLLKELAGHVGSDAFGKILLAELRPGGAIAWHVDEGAYAAAHDRYHFPIVTNPSAFLLSGNEQAHLPVGILAQFDTQALHSAVNAGVAPRIHLIVDVRRS